MASDIDTNWIDDYGFMVRRCGMIAENAEGNRFNINTLRLQLIDEILHLPADKLITEYNEFFTTDYEIVENY